MSYANVGALGQADLNAPEIRAVTVGNGWTDPWLDADVEVQNIGSSDAARVPNEVRQALVDSGATVDSAAWGANGKVHVSWKPNATYNAVDYANIAKRVIAQAARSRLGGTFGAAARIIMPRYRINNRLSSAQYVYPTSTPVIASAPSLAKMPIPGEGVAPATTAAVTAPVVLESAGPLTSPLIMATAAIVSAGLVGTAIYVSRARAPRKNRRRHR